MTIRTYRTEFPDFDPATMPKIPADWTDISWHNDLAPSFLAAAGHDWEIIVRVDYADPADRDLGSPNRFVVCQMTNEGPSGEDELYAGNDWTAAVAAVRLRAAELRLARQRSA